MFSPETFAFLRDLRAHNDRAWFEANRARYEAHGKAAMAAFVRAFRPHLAAISGQYLADEKTSAFRIFRDTRFSKDKSPYKTYLGVQFRHQLVTGSASERVHAPGFYCHVGPAGDGEMDGCFGGFGTWHPEGDALAAIRRRIAERPEAWAEAKGSLVLGGESLKKTPLGYDPAHVHAADLRRKDFVVMHDFTEAQVVAPDFVDRYAAAAREAAPLMRFLCVATGLPW